MVRVADSLASYLDSNRCHFCQLFVNLILLNSVDWTRIMKKTSSKHTVEVAGNSVNSIVTSAEKKPLVQNDITWCFCVVTCPLVVNKELGLLSGLHIERKPSLTWSTSGKNIIAVSHWFEPDGSCDSRWTMIQIGPTLSPRSCDSHFASSMYIQTFSLHPSNVVRFCQTNNCSPCAYSIKSVWCVVVKVHGYLWNNPCGCKQV